MAESVVAHSVGAPAETGQHTARGAAMEIDTTVISPPTNLLQDFPSNKPFGMLSPMDGR
jgi:hypothetical protein